MNAVQKLNTSKSSLYRYINGITKKLPIKNIIKIGNLKFNSYLEAAHYFNISNKLIRKLLKEGNITIPQGYNNRSKNFKFYSGYNKTFINKVF